MTRPFLPACPRSIGALLAVGALLLAGCTAGAEPAGPDDEPTRAAAGGPEVAEATRAEVTTSVDDLVGPVPVEEILEVLVEQGTLLEVVVRGGGRH